MHEPVEGIAAAPDAGRGEREVRWAGASAAMTRCAARIAGGSAATGVHLSKRRKANAAAAMRDRRCCCRPFRPDGCPRD